jgi:hypothetical protein
MGLLAFSSPTAYSVGEFGTTGYLENREMPSGFILFPNKSILVEHYCKNFVRLRRLAKRMELV